MNIIDTPDQYVKKTLKLSREEAWEIVEHLLAQIKDEKTIDVEVAIEWDE